MIILAFDLGTKTGVAVGDPLKAPRFFTERLGEAGGKQAARFTQALIMTKRLIDEHRPDLIAIEAPLAQGGGGAQTRIQLAMGIRACVLSVAYQRQVQVVEKHANSIRKHFLGYGRMKRAEAKKATMAQCWRLGWKVDTDDEADACALFDMAATLYGKRMTYPRNSLFEGEVS